MNSYFGMELTPGYGAAKGGLVQLIKTLAIRLAKRNIRVNAVAAKLTESRMTANTFETPAWTESTLASTPLAQLGSPVDIVGPVLLLTGSLASFIIGQPPPDGGFTIMMLRTARLAPRTVTRTVWRLSGLLRETDTRRYYECG